MKTFLSLILPLLISSMAFGQDSQPRVGRGAAARYFQKRDPAQTYQGGAASDHYLALHFGRYMASQSYEWGKNGQEDDVGKNNFGVTYRVGEWQNSMDLNLRLDYSEFEVGGEKPTKLSFLPLITFPDASSRFPLYFGAGLGLGVFFKQASGKSSLSLDYQLVAGARFFDIFENTGFFIEAGLKNHLLILSSGQLNGTFLSGGLVFTF
ncbi:hypothetical protein [Bdellovibrio sp.]|uniref:hypothetical protein n=1 Tax=Bdellovibrio sp. TaxID=28201 RepID=UPI0039E539B7